MTDRKIDALVAEKVMGWEWRPDTLSYARAPVLVPPGYTYNSDIHPIFMIGYTADLPHYSTEIAAAWQVAEKMRLSVEPWSNTGWLAWQPPAQGWYCPADTAPMAICLAALKVVGVEV